MIKHSLIILFALFSPVAFAEDNNGQIIKGATLTDFDYGFILTSPGENWFFQEENKINQIVPDAVAGLFNSAEKSYTVVIPEQFPGVTLSDYADLLIDNAPIENKNIVFKKEASINNRKAFQFMYTGEFNGVNVTYFATLHDNQGFKYQIFSWWLSDLCTGAPESITSIHSSFDFIPGAKPRVRISTPKESHYGVGWRVKNNVYENGIYGLKMTLPSKEWSYMGSDELKTINSDAIMGLSNNSIGVFMIIIAEPLGALTGAEYEQLVINNFTQSQSIESHETSNLDLFGKQLTQHFLKERNTQNTLTQFAFLITDHRNFGYQVLSWWLSGTGSNNKSELKKVYSGISWLEKKEKEGLVSELLNTMEMDRSITSNDCYIKRKYTNFPFGFSLQVPKRFWSHLIGVEARMINEDVALFATEQQMGLSLSVVLEFTDLLTSETYHKTLLENLNAPPESKTSILKVNKQVIRSTRFPQIISTQKFIYHLVTSSVNNKHCQIVMQGLESVMAKTIDLEKEIINGINLFENPILESERLVNGSFINRRFGYLVFPDDKNWRIEEATPDKMKGLESLINIVDPKENRTFTAGAVHTDLDNNEAILELITNVLNLRSRELTLISEQKSTWRNNDATIQIYGPKGLKSLFNPSKLIVSTASVGGTVYIFVEGSIKDESDSKRDMLVF